MRLSLSLIFACILAATTQAADKPPEPDYYGLVAWVDWAREEIARLEAARIEDAFKLVILQEKLEAALAGNVQAAGIPPYVWASARRVALGPKDIIYLLKLEESDAASWEMLTPGTPDPDPEPDPDPLPDPVPSLIAPFSIRGTEFTAINGPLPTGNSLTSFGVGGWVEYQFETGVDATWQVELTSLVPGEGGLLTVSIDGIQTNLDLPFSGKAWGIVTFPAGEWALEYGEHVLRVTGMRASPASQWGWIMDLSRVEMTKKDAP